MTLDADVVRSRCAEIERALDRLDGIREGVYWTVDYDRVFDILERHLGDLRAFSRAMAGLL